MAANLVKRAFGAHSSHQDGESGSKISAHASRQDGESGSKINALPEQILQPVRQSSGLIFKQLDFDDPSIHMPTASRHCSI